MTLCDEVTRFAGAHRRSMSQRELSRPPSMEGGIIDAFGFVATNGHASDFSSPVSYSSAANLQFDLNRNQRTSLHYHRPPEVRSAYVLCGDLNLILWPTIAIRFINLLMVPVCVVCV